MVPMFTCGFLRSNFPLAARTVSERRRNGEAPEEGVERTEYRKLEEALVKEEAKGGLDLVTRVRVL